MPCQGGGGGKGLGAVGMDLGLVAGASSGSAGGVGGALVGVVGRGSAVALGGVLGRVALGGVLGRGWDMALGGLLGRGSDVALGRAVGKGSKVALGGLLGEGSEVPVGGGGGGLLGTASALVLGGAMVLPGVTLGMGLRAGRGAVGSEEPVAVAALPGGYFGGVGNFGLLRPGGSSATEACTVHFKDKRVHRTCITVYGVRAQVYIYIGTCI